MGRGRRPWWASLALSILLALLPALAGGCWDIIDIQGRALILGLGMDAEPDGRLTLTLQVPAITTPTAGRTPAGPGRAQTVSLTGTTLPETLSLAQSMLSQTLFLGHLRVVLFGEEAVRAPHLTEETLEFLLRSPQVDETAYLVVAHGRAQDVLQAPTEPFPAAHISDTFDNVRRGLPVTPTVLWEVLRDIETPGREVLMPGIIRQPAGLVLSGTAVFENFRFAGWLPEAETVPLGWFFGRDSGFIVTVPTSAGTAGVTILRLRTRISPRLEDGRPAVDVTASAVGAITRKPHQLGEITSRDFTVIRRAAEAEMQRRMTATLHDLQGRLQVDALGLGRHFYYLMPQVWDRLNWKEEFPRLTVRIQVKMALKRKGVIR